MTERFLHNTDQYDADQKQINHSWSRVNDEMEYVKSDQTAAMMVRPLFEVIGSFDRSDLAKHRRSLMQIWNR